MTVSNIKPLPGTLDHAVSRVKDMKATHAIILYTHPHPDDPEVEAVSVEFTGNVTFKDWTFFLFVLGDFIKREYVGDGQ